MFQLCTVKGYIERKAEVKEKPGQTVKIIPMTPRTVGEIEGAQQ